MEIKIQQLTLENFKGLRSFTLEPDGKDICVHGDNGTGKTTLMDAFLWLLFGKDSQGRTDFQIKTLDESGQVIHGLDHSVEAHLLIDNKPLVLKKTYREKWVKKRGSAKATLTGHEVNHFVDGVPCKKGEWDGRLADLINEEQFRLLTSPTYFNSLHWQKRRDVLLQVCGDVEDKEVISSNKDLAPLPEILGERSLEEHRKVVKSRQSEINKRLQEIPARIDELHRSIPKEPRAASEIEKNIQDLEARLQSMQADGGLSELENQRRSLVSELDHLRKQAEREHRERASAVEDRKKELQRKMQQLERDLTQMQEDMARKETLISGKHQSIEGLRQEFKDRAAQEAQADDTCPACGQGLPEDQVQAATEKFNQAKARDLEEINQKGKTLKSELETLEQEKKNLEQEIKEIQPKIEDLKQQISTSEEELQQVRAETSTSQDQAIQDLEKKLADLDQKIQGLHQNKPDTSATRAELQAERNALSSLQAAEKTRQRISELEAEEKSLASEYEDLEHQTHLMESFIVSKVNLLEDRINSRFEMARFKLFEQQINGGISETCETLYQGVPFHGGLNRGAQTNVGLDIIRTLSDHYQIKAPVFIDNAEAVTKLINPGTQVIKLIVDPDKQELEIKK